MLVAGVGAERLYKKAVYNVVDISLWTRRQRVSSTGTKRLSPTTTRGASPNDQETIADYEQRTFDTETIIDNKERLTTDSQSTKSEDAIYLEVESYLQSGKYPSSINKQEKAVIRKR